MYEIELLGNGEVMLKQQISMVSGTEWYKVKYTSEANMPDELRTKLSALKMVTPPDGYEDIGQRVNETIFWIYD